MHTQLVKQAVPHTYRKQLAEFAPDGQWVWIGYFYFAVRYVENGVPRGTCCGVPIANIGSCAVCGTYITNHYTVRHPEHGTWNIGSECLRRVVGEKAGDRIRRGAESIRRKIAADYRRPFKTAQLLEWLAMTYEQADAARNRRIDAMLAAAPLAYQPPPLGPKGTWAPYQTEEWRRQIAMESESFDRIWWLEVFHGYRDHWSPDTMRKVLAEHARQDGMAEPPKWAPLTDEQQQAEAERIVAALATFRDGLNDGGRWNEQRRRPWRW